MAGGLVIVPWYATGFRAAAFSEALDEIAPVALRYGASSYAVYRARDDLYKFQQVSAFADHLDWQRYWEGPEMTFFRGRYSSWYQVPIVYGWWDETSRGEVEPEPVAARAGNGAGEGNGFTTGESA